MELKVKKGFLVCPVCRQRTPQRIDKNTKADNLPLWCPRCKNETIIRISGASAEVCGPR